MSNRTVNKACVDAKIFSLSVVSLILVAIGSARADESCIASHVTFDGIQALTYKQVTGDPNAKIYIYHNPETKCRAPETGQCTAPYVVPGAIVAVAKACGDLAFVQYIGERTITTGWVQSKSLEIWQPPSGDERFRRVGDETRMFKARFKLIHGKGVPVCEAYLQRLNMTYFDSPPYCGRPESSAVPGFERLNRVYLATKDVNEICGSDVPDKFMVATWRYHPEIDVDNDGQPDNVLIWNLDDRRAPSCGVNSGGPSGLDTGLQIAVILEPDNRTLDLNETLEVFADKDTKTAEKISLTKGHGWWLHEFPIYGSSYSLFRYRGTTYFDTYDRKKRDPITGDVMPTRLRVFLHREHRTSAICTLG